MMATGAGRAAVIGAAVAVVVVAMGMVGVLVWAGGATDEPVDRYLLIVTAPGEDGAEVAVLAAVVGPRGAVDVVDVLAGADVPGTSARTAQEAYPFGGGDAVARALEEQTRGERLPWVVVPAQTVRPLVDQAGGLEVDVPSGLSAYANGSLALFEPGVQRLEGAEALALVSAAGFLEDPAARLALQEDVGADVSMLLAGTDGRVRELVASGRARSSLPAEGLPE